jgi:hypothetical protein
MGATFYYKCQECGSSKFEVQIGPGMASDIERCDRCGKARWVELFNRPVSSNSCECGGTFAGDSPVRCPNCRSTSVEPIGDWPHILWD